MKMATYAYTLNPGEVRRLAVRGRFVRGMSSDAPYMLRIGSEAPTRFQTGIAFESPREFDQVELINSHATAQRIEIVISDGFVDDNRLVGQVDISGGIRAAGNRSATAGAMAVSTIAVEVAPPEPARAAMLIQNLGAANLFVGIDGTVSASTGIRVAPGGLASLTLQGAIWAVAEAGSLDVRYLEEIL